AGVKIVDEEALPVVAELRHYDQRYVLAAHQRIGPDPRTECNTEIPTPNRHAVVRRARAIVRGESRIDAAERSQPCRDKTDSPPDPRHSSRPLSPSAYTGIRWSQNALAGAIRVCSCL